MNILIINQPLNNRGDESAHKGLVRALVNAIPDCNIRVLFRTKCHDSIDQYNIFHKNVKYINIKHYIGDSFIARYALKHRKYGLWNLHPTSRMELSNFKWADWVICAPGGICMGGFQNWNHLFSKLNSFFTSSILSFL